MRPTEKIGGDRGSGGGMAKENGVGVIGSVPPSCFRREPELQQEVLKLRRRVQTLRALSSNYRNKNFRSGGCDHWYGDNFMTGSI
jgi:hypothetical protein